MIPRTLLARTFLLLAALVILTTTAWLSVFRYIEAEPRARETAQLATSAVNLIRAAAKSVRNCSTNCRPARASGSCRRKPTTVSKRCQIRASTT